ncbi:hypothetical protein DQ04_01241160 [Trypanosoma grayi]|uniref:hypothetical protein n=1 Tax=Trypanosoma grayi TaxID=71804 RepID=UPI0004F45858|nr:hypothetical protein DQ04_01241160 [Trypanosoma grayi]KEG13061.1 hypothetical protein DQ04_01241160 [Trypanosoma grayi]
MASEQRSRNYGWCVGFSELLESTMERRLGELWQRLLDCVRSEDALADAVRGPRTDWNPYRPARGEHLLQGVLNSEVYEWRSCIAVNSLHVSGLALPVGEASVSLSNALGAGKPLFFGVKEAGDTTSGLTSDRTGAHCTEHVDVSSDNSSEATDVMITDSNTGDACDAATQQVVEAFFDMLWRTVAVPWIMEQYAGPESCQLNTKEPEVHGRPPAALRLCYADHGSCFSIESGSPRGRVVNRRRPTTGPALRRGRTVGRVVPLPLAGTKSHSREVHSPNAAPRQRVVPTRLENVTTSKQQQQQRLVEAKQVVYDPSEVSSPSKQRRISSFKVATLVPSLSTKAETRHSMLGTLTVERVSLQGRDKSPSNALGLRDASPLITRLASKSRQRAVSIEEVDGSVEEMRGPSFNPAHKLAPLPTRAKEQVKPAPRQRHKRGLTH